jgi:uroporphyrinogen decarboxylase
VGAAGGLAAIAGLRATGAPVILYVNGCGHLIEAMAESGADVLSVDWRVPLSEVAAARPARAAGQPRPGAAPRHAGARRRAHRRDARADRRRAARRNLGHGILPGSRIECVEAFFERLAPRARTARAARRAAGSDA